MGVRQKFRSAKLADALAEKASRETGELIISYQCFDCGKWHIGHADEAQLAARNLAGAKRIFCVICDKLIPADRIQRALHDGSIPRHLLQSMRP